MSRNSPSLPPHTHGIPPLTPTHPKQHPTQPTQHTHGIPPQTPTHPKQHPTQPTQHTPRHTVLTTCTQQCVSPEACMIVRTYYTTVRYVRDRLALHPFIPFSLFLSLDSSYLSLSIFCLFLYVFSSLFSHQFLHTLLYRTF
jgi:hypothetical protein